MSRKYRIKRSKPSLLSRLLPEAMQAFVARRVIDATGALFALGGAFVLAAIFSYSPDDPSVNTAGADSLAANNWMGAPGAGLADLLVQTLGTASLLFGLLLGAWGISILKRRPLPNFWLRIIVAGFAAVAAAVALARVPGGILMAQPYLGGSVGALLLQNLADMFHGIGIENAHGGAAIGAGIAAAVALSYALAVRWDEWLWALACVRDGLIAFAYGCYNAALGFYDWVRHYGNADYAPAPRIARPAAVRRRAPQIARDEDDEDSDDEQDEEEGGDEEEGDEDNDPITLAADPKLAAAVRVVTPAKSAAGERQGRFQLFDAGEWELPSLDLLQEVPEEDTREQFDENALRMNAELLQNVLADFNIKGEIVSIHPGPVVTLYELEPAPGVKTSRVIGLADDIARSMSAVSVRAAVVPGRNVIGIELPNKRRQTVYLRDLLSTREYEKSGGHLPLVLGKDIGGRPIIADLARMPHLLVAGTTGSGKSVAINTMILSLLYRLSPEKCRFIMIDPKMLELSVYDDIPHLLAPVVTEPGRAIVALKWVVAEMEERYRAMSKLGVRNIEGYNARLREAVKKGEVLMRKVQTGFDPGTGKPVYEEQPLDTTELPYIVVVVDEFADLMLVAGKDVENAIQRLAQMARAAGIHLIMATQRPSVDVITGVIKANFPTRISFAVTSKIDSRTILGDGGAEQLLGQGDMLYMAPGGRISRVHGPFASDSDVENVVTFLKSQAEPAYLEDITEGSGDFGDSEVMGALFGEGESSGDELYDQAVALVARERKASTSFIQRHLQIGYNRAARIIEEMEKQGVVSPANRVGKREVLVGDHDHYAA